MRSPAKELDLKMSVEMGHFHFTLHHNEFGSHISKSAAADFNDSHFKRFVGHGYV